MTVPISVMKAISKARVANEDRRAFFDANTSTIKEYERLKSAEEDAIKAVRSLITSKADSIDEENIEGFTIRYDTVVDVEKLLELCPELDSEFSVALSKKRYNELVKAGRISEEVQAEVESESETPTITKPKW